VGWSVKRKREGKSSQERWGSGGEFGARIDKDSSITVVSGKDSEEEV